MARMHDQPPLPSAAPGAGADSHPYAALTPDVVLDALASVGLYGDGRLTALSSYENRVYQIHLEDPYQGNDVVVAKFYRPGRWSREQILEEHAFSAELMEQDIPVIGPLNVAGETLHSSAGFQWSVSPRRGGRPPELDDFEVLEWTGRFLARIHTVGSARPFAARGALDLQTFAVEPKEWLLASGMIPLDVQSAWQKACEEAIALIATYDLLTLANTQNDSKIRLHGDCHPGNILWTPADLPGAGPHFVDLDDARMGPAVQDLWMLMSGDRAAQTAQLDALLEGYRQFRDFDTRELTLIEPLRTLRLIHYSAWLARRWHDPIFPINFPWFGSRDYWQGQVNMLHEQLEAMQDEPLQSW